MHGRWDIYLINQLYHLFNDCFGFDYNHLTARENCLREVEKHLSTEGNGGRRGEQEKSSCERDVALRRGAFYRATYRTRGGAAAPENTRSLSAIEGSHYASPLSHSENCVSRESREAKGELFRKRGFLIPFSCVFDATRANLSDFGSAERWVVRDGLCFPAPTFKLRSIFECRTYNRSCALRSLNCTDRARLDASRDTPSFLRMLEYARVIRSLSEKSLATGRDFSGTIFRMKTGFPRFWTFPLVYSVFSRASFRDFPSRWDSKAEIQLRQQRVALLLKWQGESARGSSRFARSDNRRDERFVSAPHLACEGLFFRNVFRVIIINPFIRRTSE